MGVRIQAPGSFKNTESYLHRLLHRDFEAVLKSFGQRGVDALVNATPTDTGETKKAWKYHVNKSKHGLIIWWSNDYTDDKGFPVAIMLQYGYATGTGGYVQGRDYINPAIKPIFDEIARDLEKAVTSA